MSIIITKGIPISLMVGVTENDVPVAINDGTWTTEVSIRHKTERGQEPFVLSVSPASNNIIIDITSEQTAVLNHRDNQYVFVIKASKTDGSVNIRNVLQASVVDDL